MMAFVRPKEEEKSSATSVIKKVCIVGAGPIGLYAAIQLREKAGVVDVTLIDPRAGVYTRPGMLDHKVFQVVSQRLKTQLTSHPGLFHIKELERQLYQKVTELNLNIIKEHFLSLSAEGCVITQGSVGQRQVLSCDLVLDCTGSSRAVIHSANKITESKIFTVARMAENPIKTHFCAYVKLQPDDFNVLNVAALEQRGISYIKTMQLLHDLGWEYSHSPEAHFFDFSKNKLCLYCEIPPGLSTVQQEAWVAAILRLKTSRDAITFVKIENSKKYGKKPRFLAFDVDPHGVMETVFLGNDKLPFMIIPAGDAQIEPDYRLGFGILSGMDRMDAFIESLLVHQGAIVSINFPQYNEKIASLMAHQKIRMATFYQNNKKRQSNEVLLESYKMAINIAGEKEEQEKIKRDFEGMQMRLAKKLYEKGVKEYQGTIVDAKASNQAESDGSQIDLLFAAKELFSRVLKILPEAIAADDPPVADWLWFISRKLQEEGRRFFMRGSYKESERCYREALDIYLTSFPGCYLEEVAWLYSSLVLLASNKENSDQACQLADKALTVIPGKMAKKDKLITRIYYGKVNALLTEALTRSNTRFFDKQRAQALIMKASWLMPLLTAVPEYEQLKKKFDDAVKKQDYQEKTEVLVKTQQQKTKIF